MGFFNKVVDSFFEMLIDALTWFLETLITYSTEITINLLEMPMVVNAIISAQAIVFMILALKVTFEMGYQAHLRKAGEIHSPQDALVGIGEAVIAVFLVPWIVRQMFIFGGDLTLLAVGLSGGGYQSESGGLLSELKALKTIIEFPFIIFIFVLIFVVAFLVIIIQMAIRAMQLTYLSIVGAFMAMSLTNQVRGSTFSFWWRDVIAITTTQASQMLLVKLGFEAFLWGTKQFDVVFGCLVFIGALVAAILIPQQLREYVHNTGVGRAVGGVASGVGSAAIMRLVLRR